MAPDAPTTGTVLAWVDRDLSRSRDDAGQQIEGQEHHSAEPVLDVVAEHPQKQHVEPEVQPSSVQEHRGDHREVDVLAREQWGAVVVLVAGRAVALIERARHLVDSQRVTLHELAGDGGELEVEPQLAVDAHSAAVDLDDIGTAKR